MADTAVQVEIYGRVQGVGYRAWLQQVATMFGLNGWVRNRHDGWVEAVISGPTDQIDAIVALMERGPPGSRPENVAVRPATDDETASHNDGFAVLPDF
ncbi:acylphosphatase [Flaviflagellibacter deserti]|uniref:acylphosphatase n=1 Tax=Flaviflagellibacter deserti TaxID=2267266 RepID=A0ABV9Z226_9HYPH